MQGVVFLRKCINYVEKRFTFSHFEVSIIPYINTSDRKKNKFMITIYDYDIYDLWLCLSVVEKKQITESGARRSSKWGNLLQIFRWSHVERCLGNIS